LLAFPITGCRYFKLNCWFKSPGLSEKGFGFAFSKD
jgi:hypothetical protein